MIICAKGYDRNTTRAREYYPFVINTKDVLYVRGRDESGQQCVVYLKYDVIESRNEEKYTYPIWITLDMSVEDFYKIWKEADKYE